MSSPFDSTRRSFLSLAAALPGAVNVRDFGAKPGDTAGNTAAFKKAIESIRAAGGGTLHVPPGEYVSGPIDLISNMTLHLDSGAVIKGSPRLEDYAVETDSVSGESARTGLVTARKAENVRITGMGVIDGNALAFNTPGTFRMGRDTDKRATRQKDAWMDRKFGADQGPWEHGERPGNVLRFIECRNAVLDTATVRDSPTWTVQLHQCDNVSVSNAWIHSHGSNRCIANDDGIDVKGCRNVRITNCNIETGDDCIALFGSERVTVSNCTLRAKSAGIRINYGEGDTRDCVFTGLTVDSNCGLKLNARGSGSAENIVFRDIVLRTRFVPGHWWGKAEPIHISAIPMNPKQPKTGVIRNVRFHNIAAESEAGVVIHGSPESVIEDLQVRDVRIRMKKGLLQESYGGNFDLRGLDDFSRALAQHDIPAFYFRHVRGLDIDGLDIAWDANMTTFHTYAVEGEDYSDVSIRGFRGAAAHGGEPVAFRRGPAVKIEPRG